MALFDVDFMALCEVNKIHVDLNERYDDDDDDVQPAIPKGYRVHNGKVKYREEWRVEDEEKGLAEDERTMLVMMDLANTIHKNIEMTGDCPMGAPSVWRYVFPANL